MQVTDPLHSRSGTTLSHRSSLPETVWRWLLRAGWLLLCALVLLIMRDLWAHNYTRTYYEWVVSRTRPTISTLMPYDTWVHVITWLELISALTALLVGAILFWKKSDDRIGLLASTYLIVSAPWILSSNMELWRLPAWLPLAPQLLALVQALVLASLIAFLYLFPDGRCVPRWTRWPLAATLALLGLFVVNSFVKLQTRFGGSIWLLTVTIFFGNLLLAAFAQLHRYRRHADALQRRQTQWVVFGIALYVGALCLTLLSLRGAEAGSLTVIELLAQMLATWLLPVTIGISITRYRLWHIDPLLNRTLVYGGLTALLLVVYGMLLGLLSQLLSNLYSGLAPLLVTGLIVVLVEPLRHRLQQLVNQLLYGAQSDPLVLLTDVGRRLEATADAGALLPTLVQTTATALRLPYVAVQLNGATAPIAAYGSVNGATESWPLLYQGMSIGRLDAARRTPAEAFTAREQRLLATIAQQAGAAAHALQLTTDLRQSRQRLVVAREEERRRLRRDLHDGLGPQLATLALQIDAARNVLTRDSAAADALLRDLKAGAQNAITEIRNVAHDLRPPALDQLGLVEAVRQYAAGVQHNGLRVTIAGPDALPPLPAAVEVAAYRIAVEALTNVVRHAHATHCTVRLSVVDGALHLAVADDGVGLADGYQPGVGLASMRERAAELSGTLSISQHNGVRVAVSLPLDPLQSAGSRAIMIT